MKAPDYVKTTLEKRYWRKLLTVLQERGTPVQTIDHYALGILACNLATVEECREDLRENGIHVEVSGDRGHIVRKRNPSFDLLKESQAQVKHYLSQFKMSPASRGVELNLQGDLDVLDDWDKL